MLVGGEKMLDIDRIISNVHSRFDEVFYGRGDRLIVCPMGGMMDIALQDAEHIENIYCLEDRNPEFKEKYGYPVKSREEICREKHDCKVLILSSLHYSKIKEEYLKYIEEDRILPYMNYDTRIHFNYSADRYKKWLKTHREDILSIYDVLADEKSKRSFEFLLNGAEHYSAAELMDMGVYSATEHPDNFHKFDFFPLSEREAYLDVGAYDGDTISDFLQAVDGSFESITAVEPDPELFEKLSAGRIGGKVRCLKIGLGDSVAKARLRIAENRFFNELTEDSEGDFEIRTLDSLGENFSLIKISVCGPDVRRKILKGGMKLLKEKRPKLIVLIERYEDDILNIAQEILTINPDYKIFLRFMVWQQGESFRLNCAYWAV